MTKYRSALWVMLGLAARGFAQPSTAPLVLTGAIPLPHVQGRIDHLGLDPKGRWFIPVLGNDREEVLDLAAGTRARTITGIPRPQGVVYSPETNKLFVSSDEGKLYMYDGTSIDPIAALEYGDHVDNLRYDAAERRGYGDEEAGAIAIVDVNTNQRLTQEFKFGAHPEAFQLEKSGLHIYVNVADLKEIAVIDRNPGRIARWPLTSDGNFPMALDQAEHRLFVVSRAPARLVVVDTNSGRAIVDLPCVQNSDDVFYDAALRASAKRTVSA
ncbi:MAG TPA: hypothetical protein VNY29_11500 [Terriglobales bacterium]|jgi:DNA-binding beta-propeller fold protein YncE|nr:hypothetical protein [Terriglobales bacterium]